MTDEQWQAAWKLYQSGGSLPPEQVHAFLNTVTTDPEVRNAVLAMLERSTKVETLDRIGQKIGRYVLTGRLGEGGMGEVYAARDTELGRAVAVKLLTRAPAGQSSPVERFIREAKAASALNHPNIVTIYEVIHSESRLALVMELVDGVALRQLCGTPLPADRVIHLGEQTLRALAAAHARGIVHCDIKPENLMVRQDGFVKILDFGLAQDVTSASAGSVLPAGTLRYMSPEQSRGEMSSAASDVFSFGIVLYELATGVHPFDKGGSIFDALKALNQAEPAAPSSLNAFVPAHLESLILRMLAKDPNLRPTAAEAAQLMGSRFASPPAALPVSAALAHAGAKGTSTPRRVLWSVACAIVLTAGLAAVLWPIRHGIWNGAERNAPLLQLDLSVGAEVSQLAVSPDGSQVVFLKANQLVLRQLDEPQMTPIAGTEGASYPFFSPDGKWVAFFSAGKLRKIATTGGSPITLCDAQSGRGGSWGDDGRIVATLSSTGGLFELPSSGGTPRPLTDLNGESAGVTSHRWPQVLPHAKGVLFTATIAGGAIGSVRVLSRNGKAKTLVENAPYGRYLASGHLVYYSGGKVFAVPFDLDRLEITGPPTLLVDGVAADPVRGAIFEVSLSGTLLYLPGDQAAGRTLFRLSPSGAAEPLSASPGTYLTPRLAPDGKRLAAAVVQGPEQHLWIYDLAAGEVKPLTFGSEPQLLPVWTPDGQFVVFRSGSSLAWVRSDGSGKVERLAAANLNPLPSSISKDGRFLAFAGDDGATGLDLYVSELDLNAGSLRLGQPRVLLRLAGGQYAPAISPDGAWLAYTSDESGHAEVYVAPFSPEGAAASGRWQVSDAGGVYPEWSRSGRTLFYRSSDRHVMAADYTVKGGSFVADKPREWVARRLGVAGGFPSFSVTPEGNRVLGIFEPEKSDPATTLRIVLNVASELQRRERR